MKTILKTETQLLNINALQNIWSMYFSQIKYMIFDN
jgi:hypothetical protein